MAIHKKTQRDYMCLTMGVMCSLWGLMACRANYDIIVLQLVHAGFSSSYYFLAIFDKDALRWFMD